MRRSAQLRHVRPQSTRGSQRGSHTRSGWRYSKRTSRPGTTCWTSERTRPSWRRWQQEQKQQHKQQQKPQITAIEAAAAAVEPRAGPGPPRMPYSPRTPVLGFRRCESSRVSPLPHRRGDHRWCIRPPCTVDPHSGQPHLRIGNVDPHSGQTQLDSPYVRKRTNTNHGQT